MQDLRELPKLRDSLSYLYVEHCRVDREDKAVAIHDASGKTPVPCAALALLMLGPGTSITHAAVQVLAESGCLVMWMGEHGVRFYAQGMGENRSSERLLRQAKLCSDPDLRLGIIMKMYRMRFSEPLPEGLTLQQIRGREGIRVREAYEKASRATGVPWSGRSYDRDRWERADPIDRALSTANSCLYGLCHAAIVSLGYSPGLGFVHTGKQLSFVYDIADLYKTEISVPTAFRAVAAAGPRLEQDTRRMCRDAFVERKLLPRIVDDIETLLGAPGQADDIDSDDMYSEDAGRPGDLWDPEDTLTGGVNYADVTDDDRREEPVDGSDGA